MGSIAWEPQHTTHQDFLSYLQSGVSRQFLPHLSPSGWKFVASNDGTNCVGTALGLDEAVWSGNSYEDFDRLFREAGYVTLKEFEQTLRGRNIWHKYQPVPCHTKVVVYGFRTVKMPEGTIGEWEDPYDKQWYRTTIPDTMSTSGKYVMTHAIIQQADGNYLSKMGRHGFLSIGDPDALSGKLFGYPVEIYIKCTR